jgi:hypothetical protein
VALAGAAGAGHQRGGAGAVGQVKWVASAIAIIWGFAFALIPVGWSTWITRSLADQAESRVDSGGGDPAG